MNYRILLADDHAVVLEGLRRILDQPGFEVVGAVRDGHALVEAARELRPDVVVTDVSMPSLNGVEAVRQILVQKWKPKIIFFTMRSDAMYAVEAIRAGGSGYVLKTTSGEELRKVICDVLDGGFYITPSIADPVMLALGRHRSDPHEVDGLTMRQREVLQLLAEGKTPKEIGGLLNVSYKTIEYHKYAIKERLGLHTTAELAGYALKRGIIT